MSQKIDWAKFVEDQQKNLPPPTNGSGEPQEEVADEVDAGAASLLRKVIRKGLIVSKNDIEIERQNPNSPLHSVKTFEALHLNPNLLKGVYDMGFNAPSKIQETALPTLLANPPQNLIAQSQSGTGKTAAFVLAMLSRVDVTKKYPQVLCLSPTYELAIQTGEVAAHMAKFCPEIELKYAVRGEEVDRGTLLTEHIIIGTPGKVLDWALKFRVFDLKKLTVFVLDEADVMIATQGHQDQCIRIHKNLSYSCQIMYNCVAVETVDLLRKTISPIESVLLKEKRPDWHLYTLLDVGRNIHRDVEILNRELLTLQSELIDLQFNFELLLQKYKCTARENAMLKMRHSNS